MSGSLGRPGTGSFSCFHHGEKGKRPPLDDDIVHVSRRIAEWYAEAARRLPVGEIPGLAGRVAARGNCLGVADPVSNIILNAVALLRRRGRGERETRLPPPPLLPESVLVAFMTAYFRYLGDAQARRYLHLASHDLALAVRLVRHDRLSPRHQRRPLLPDGGRLKRALRAAAADARHPEPDLLAGLMTAKYPVALLAGVLAKLRRTTEPLTADRQWPPYPPPAGVEFRCRPESNGVVCTRAGDGTLQVVTCVGEEEEDMVATITITSARNQQQQLRSYISGITFDDSADMETKLAGCLQKTAAAAPASAVAVDYDASPCTHIVSLKLCLLDAIYALYIRALAVMPRGAPSGRRLLRALLAAGHCYGPMDPVSNIILSSAWYAAAAFPHAPDDADGFLDTEPMSRMGLRSLDGLVAMLCDTGTGCCRSEHEALEYLNTWDCDLSRSSRLVVPTTAFAAAAEAAKHPHHAAFGSFLMSLASQEHKLSRMRCLLTAGGGNGISGANWDELNAILVQESEPVRSSGTSAVPVPAFRPLAFHIGTNTTPRSRNRQRGSKEDKPKPAYEDKLTFLRAHLNKLLHKYCFQHPWVRALSPHVLCDPVRIWILDTSKVYHK
ncbi:unnamed protein product [Urochloa decumbens]|uniref:PIR2-like helical domain-containing protein n=1 Tax=Urochloa decumbens TaxID=240449 RepID=A0ABC8ZF29_9POAL